MTRLGRPIQEGQERTRAGSISLYPKQWEWLEAQAGEGSISKALQKLINEAIDREPNKPRG